MKDNRKVKGGFRFEVTWCLDNLFEADLKNMWETTIDNIATKLEKLGKKLQSRGRLKAYENKKHKKDLES